MRVALTGATGLIGSKLLQRLHQSGVPVVAFTRSPHKEVPLAEETRLFSNENLMDFSGCDAVVHLAGETILGRWTQAKQAEIRSSRILGTRQVAASIAQTDPRPSCLISASGIGYYGDRGDEVLTVESGPGEDFLAQLSVEWEAEAMKAANHGTRVVTPRIGFVLAKEGGGWPIIRKIFSLGAGGRLGHGDHWMPWIHVDDLTAALVFALENEALEGAFNALAPEPVTNREFTRLAAEALGRPAMVPVPASMMRLILGEMANVALYSQRATPAKLMKCGFSFTYPELQKALADLTQ